MPMHDWAKVEPGIYHMFHGAWLYAIARVLNNGLLPAPYYALTEQRVATIEADILTLRPVETNHSPPSPPGRRTGAAEPAVGLLERAKKAAQLPARRITIRDDRHQVLAVIELVSPGNIKDRENYAAFVGKATELLAAGIHLAVIDPFRPPKHAPGGLHAAIWKMVTRQRKGSKPFTLTADRPLVAASYCASAAEVVAAVQTFAIGEPVPDIPLYLTADEQYVTVPLEATYEAAWPEVPKVWRDVLVS
jgi:hypothetical protein